VYQQTLACCYYVHTQRHRLSNSRTAGHFTTGGRILFYNSRTKNFTAVSSS
jgi:hypothetical protein